MRTSLTNPFLPGSDAVPSVWAGRVAQLSDWRDVVRPRRLAGLYERGRTVLGEPGLGKSALVRRIAQDAVERGDWVTPQLRIPSGSDPLRLVAAAILELAERAGLGTARDRRIGDLLGRVRAIAAAGVSVTLDEQHAQPPHVALRDLIVELGTAAMHDDRLVLLHVDEVQNIADHDVLSQLLIALGDALAHEVDVEAPGGVVVTRHLPIAVYLSGLPDFEDVAGARKGATFARRFKTDILTAIDDDDLEAALRPFVTHGWQVLGADAPASRVMMAADAAARIVEVCRGEPFLFQLAGEVAWNAGADERILRDEVDAGWRRAEREANAHVERILERLPARERAFVEAMAALPPDERMLTRIAADAGFARASDAGTTTKRLDTVRGIVDRGKPYRFRHRAVEAYLTSDWPSLG